MQSEALRYLGFRDKAPDAATLALLTEGERQLRAACTPRFVWRVASLARGEQGLFLDGLPLLGADIAAHLTGCDRAVVLAATLSAGADALLRRLSATEMALAVVTDALASAWIEEICAAAEDEIRAKLHPPFMTWRYSPGYGDFPLTLQKPLLAWLSAQKRIGLSATETDMLLPQKSVTAVIGLADTTQKTRPQGCKSCNLRDRCGMRGGCGM